MDKPMKHPCSTYPVNSVKVQDRAEDLIDNWRKYGYVMFPQQRRIYDRLTTILRHRSLLEVGCGVGIGTAQLFMYGGKTLGTDVSPANIKFAKCLYPWIDFTTWDILEPWRGDKFQVVVAVEVIEHVADPITALKSLIAAASEEVWISTPNGTNKPRPPENPYHVCEYTPGEVIEMINEVAMSWKGIDLLSWDTFEPLTIPTAVDPLVYRIRL